MITLAMSGAASSDDAGVTSGLVNTTQQVGAALGVAVLSTLAASRSASALAAGAPARTALTDGYRLAFGTGAGLIVAAIAVSVIGFGLARRPALRSARRSPRLPADHGADGDRAAEQKKGGDQHAHAHARQE
jgi:hypothetical protein